MSKSGLEINLVLDILTMLQKDPMILDINECEQIEDVCDENSLCINEVLSYTCKCEQGFLDNGTHCEGR